MWLSLPYYAYLLLFSDKRYRISHNSSKNWVSYSCSLFWCFKDSSCKFFSLLCFWKTKNRNYSSTNNKSGYYTIHFLCSFFYFFFSSFKNHKIYKKIFYSISTLSILILWDPKLSFGIRRTNRLFSITALILLKSKFSGKIMFLTNFPQKHSEFLRIWSGV